MRALALLVRACWVCGSVGGRLIQTHEADQVAGSATVQTEGAAALPMMASVLVPSAASLQIPPVPGRGVHPRASDVNAYMEQQDQAVVRAVHPRASGVNAYLDEDNAVVARPMEEVLRKIGEDAEGLTVVEDAAEGLLGNVEQPLAVEALIPPLEQGPPLEEVIPLVEDSEDLDEVEAGTVPLEDGADLDAPQSEEQEPDAAPATKRKSRMTNRNSRGVWTEEKRAKQAAMSREKWKNPEYREKTLAGLRKTMNSESTKEKLSKASKASWAERKKQGKAPHSEERKAKIAAAIRAKWADPEYRAKATQGIKKSRKGNRKGAPLSLETRAKISDIMKSKWQDPEFRRDRLAVNRASRRTTAAQSEETRRKISETMKAKWADKDYREAQMQAFAASDRSEKISETRRSKPRKPRAKKETVEEPPMWAQKKMAAEKARERASKSVRTRVGDAASSEDSMRWYLKLIGQRRLLTPAEVNYLAKRVQKLLRWKAVRASLAAEMRQEPSDEQMAEQLGLKGAEEYRTGLKWLTKSRELLVVANLRLVVSIAKKYKNMGVPMAELVQEGTFGLITAAERYDWKRGFTISTHATWWIRQAIQRALANYSRTVRLPVHMHDLVLRMGRARRDLTQELGREPSDYEVAERLGVPEEKVRELDRAKVVGAPTSLDADVAASRKKSAPGTRKLGDLVESRKNLQDEVEESITRAHIHEVLDQHLTAREANVLKQRFGLVDGERRSLQEIGDQFEVSRERIRQIERGAIEKLRNPFVAAQLKAYVDDGQLEITPDNVGDS